MRQVIITCLVSISVCCYGQSSYVELDTIKYLGAKILDQGKKKNALSCKWQKSIDHFEVLTPFDVYAYSTGDEEYVAKDILINGKEDRLFFEKLSSGKLTLFYIQNNGSHFYIEKDSVLLELTKRDVNGKKQYKETLREWCPDCEYTNDFLKRTRFSYYYLKRFAKRYNKCQEIYRPIRFGVTGGWDFTGYTTLQDAWNIRQSPTGRFLTFGAFFDVPLLQSNISIHSEILYSKQAYSFTDVVQGYSREYIANIEAYHLPVMLRYTWWKNRWAPYLNIGGTWSHYSRLESSRISLVLTNSVLTTNREELELSPSKLAANGGGGVWYKISKRNAVFIEARMTYHPDWYVFNVFAGINF